MESERIINKLKKQLLIERIGIGIAALVFIIWWSVNAIGGEKSIIIVDGKPVTCVSSEKTAKDILSQIKSDSGENPLEIQFRQNVLVARAPRDANPVSRYKAMRMIKRVVSPVVSRWAIIADGEPVVAVPDRDVAAETLEMAKTKYGSLAKKLAEEPQIKENVTIDIAAVNPKMYKSTSKSALDFIFADKAPVKKDAIYYVKSGDIAGSIASANNLSVATLWLLNPGVNLNKLHIGDKIRIKQLEKKKAKLTVIVRDQQEKTEKIAPPIRKVSSAALYSGKSVAITPGKPGEKRVKLAIIYENGIKTGSEIIEEEILKEPVSKQVAIGIKPRPTW